MIILQEKINIVRSKFKIQIVTNFLIPTSGI